MNESKNDVNKVLFMHLVSMLAMSAIQQMGKLVNPATGKAAINLEAAQATIDMLDMLEARTHGNLDADETRLLKDTLMSLKMNYVESVERTPDAGRQTPAPGPAKAEGGGTEKQTTDDGRQTTDTGPAKAKNGNEDKTPKYHKKYE